MNIIDCSNTINTSQRTNSIGYVAIHYTASTNSKKGRARSEAAMFALPKTKASADFIVDDEEIVQYNPSLNSYYCWAVGETDSSRTNSLAASLKGIADNGNSVSIELCSSKRDGGKSYLATDTDWYFTEAVLKNGAVLAWYLLDNYNLSKDKLIMHNTVSGKLCPAPWTQNEDKLKYWYQFKERVMNVGYAEWKEFKERYEAEQTVPYDDKDIIKNKLAEAKELGISDCSNLTGLASRWQTILMCLGAYKKAKEDAGK